MSAITDEIIRSLRQAVTQEAKPKTQAYDTQATVRRVEGNTAWVHIPGGVDETPIEMTVNAKAGDTVQVRVSGGRAFLIGNASAPPTDDTKANDAIVKAKVAQMTAEDAAEAAETAWGYADTAKAAAESAQESADSAAGSANSALMQLSIVEDVAGTLNWIREHGEYVRTTDTTVQADRIYFQMISGDYVPIANPDPTANPAESGWYVLDVTDSQSDYIMAHLAVTSAGLWVLPNGQFVQHPVVDSGDDALIDSDQNPIIDWQKDPQNAGGYKVLLSSTGMTIFDGDGVAVASYGIEMIIGRLDSGNLLATSNGIAIRDGLKELATFGATESRIGDVDSRHVVVGDDGVDVMDGNDLLMRLGFDPSSYVPLIHFGTDEAWITGEVVDNGEFWSDVEIRTECPEDSDHPERGGRAFIRCIGGDGYTNSQGIKLYAKDKDSGKEAEINVEVEYFTHDSKIELKADSIVDGDGTPLARLVVESKSLSNVTLAANGYGTASGSVAKTGYTPLAVVGIAKSGAGSGYAVSSGHYISGTTATVAYVNVSSSSITVGTNVYVLYMKS